jgi:two-component system, OmpR family, response regulator MprA
MKKILLIDDDEIFAKTLMDTLVKDKYTISHFSNGKDGLNELVNNKPDLIILDLIMPQMGGLEFLEALKKIGGNKIPILISSQLSKMEDISTAIVAGMDIGVKGYIIKSSENLEMIIGEIDKALGLKS